MDLAAANLHYLLKKKSTELHQVLEPSIIEEIVERAIRFYRADLVGECGMGGSGGVFEALMKVRGCDSIFQLLEQERQKIIETET